jgi:hypothetical protein
MAQGLDRIGAPDLEGVLALMSRSHGWTNDIFKNPDPDLVLVGNTENESIVINRLSKVLLARWVVFAAFIQVAREVNGGVVDDRIRRNWLFFQILPLVRVDNIDPFSALIRNCLTAVTSDVLDVLYASYGPQQVLGSDFNSTASFFYVLDEAQVAGEQFMGAFADSTGTSRRPVLRPIIQYLTTSEPPVNLVVSGTGFSLQLFQTVLTSGIGKGSPQWQVVHATGDFSQKDTQLAYISRFLPPSFLLSTSGMHIKARMYEWLRGRYVVVKTWAVAHVFGSGIGSLRGTWRN